MYFKNLYREKKSYIAIGAIGRITGHTFTPTILGDGCG